MLHEKKFKDLLKISQHQMKHLLKDADEQIKKRCHLALVVRNLLIVTFAILFVGGARTIFGVNNTSVAVAFFCILLQSQYVSYGYNIRDSIINLAIMSTIFAVATTIVPVANPFISFILNFSFIFIIALMACDNPKMGNVAVYVDSYLFTTFFQVSNAHEYKLRLIEILIGFTLCAVAFYYKHHDKDKDVTFISRVKTFDLKTLRSRWQLKLALGMSSALLFGQLLNIPRYFWIAIACFSVLAPFEKFSLSSRIFQRLFGVIVGSLCFGALGLIFPKSVLYSVIGPIGGFIIGFSTTYHWSSAINCFGALALAASIYGANFSIQLRIFNNLLGCLISTVVVVVFYEIIKRTHLHLPDAERIE